MSNQWRDGLTQADKRSGKYTMLYEPTERGVRIYATWRGKIEYTGVYDTLDTALQRWQEDKFTANGSTLEALPLDLPPETPRCDYCHRPHGRQSRYCSEKCRRRADNHSYYQRRASRDSRGA